MVIGLYCLKSNERINRQFHSLITSIIFLLMISLLCVYVRLSIIRSAAVEEAIFRRENGSYLC